MGEQAFFRQYSKGRDRTAIRLLKVASVSPVYLFIQNDPLSLFDPLGLDYCVTWTDPFGGGTYTTCYTPESDAMISKQAADRNECLNCTTGCALKFGVGVSRDQLLERGAEAAVEELAKRTVKKYLKKAIPVVGAISTAYELNELVTCTTDCWTKSK
jgi:hypothetical protein